MNGYKPPSLDVIDLVDAYLKKSDWWVKQDANVDYSFPGLMNYVVEGVIKKYALTHALPKDLAEAHDKGDIYIHDLGKHVVGYCAGWDITTILTKGFRGVPGKCSAGPAKHLQAALDHISRFILTVCNEWAGAQAVSSLDTYMAPFIEEDRLTQKELKNSVQGFMYDLSTSTRYGGQVPFSNITLDWVVPDDLRDQPVIIGGKPTGNTYGQYQREMDMFNRALIEVLVEGDYDGHPFSFPMPTYNITEDFDWDSENADLLFEMTAKYGNPYFQNFVGSNLNPGDVRAMCCRLQMDMKELRQKTGGIWGAGASTGSIGVVDVNLGRLGYLAKGSEQKFMRLLGERMGLCRDVLEGKRKQISKYMKKGLGPYTKVYLGTFDNHFSTVGLVGMNEALLNLIGKDIGSEEGIAFTIKVLKYMRKKITKYQEETGNLYNLEASPAESASHSLALKDTEQYPDIKTAGNGTPYYTNSTQLPSNYTDDVFEALEKQEEIQSMYNGGTVFHVFLGERLQSGKECKRLVKKIAYNYKVPYFSITPTFSVCPEHGYIKGEVKKCPHKQKNGKACKEIPLVYSRVVGYYRPVQRWNDGKTEEYKSRKDFSVSGRQACDTCDSK